jgi:ABC-type transporter Mla MlaB component
MYTTQKGLGTGGSAAGRGAPRDQREPARGSTRVALELARLPPNRPGLASGARDIGPGRQQVAAGQLVVRWQRGRGGLIIWLSGCLDRGTSTLLDREFDAAASASTRLTVDLTGLRSIDTSGLESLRRIQGHASGRGDSVSFRHGPHVARDPLKLSGTVLPRARWASRHAAASRHTSAFARARPRADVDHEPPDDRPRAA